MVALLVLEKVQDFYYVKNEHDCLGKIVDNGYRFSPYDSDINISEMIEIGKLMKEIVRQNQPNK